MKNTVHTPYESLLRSIDFFSQNLHIDQIAQYGFKLFIDLVEPTQSVLYILKGNTYVPAYVHNHTNALPDIPKTKRHQDFAVYSGFVLDEKRQMRRYFNGDLIEQLETDYIMPLISGNQLLGFILYNRKDSCHHLDYTFMMHFCHLMNLAVEKAYKYEEHARMKTEISKRRFSLSSLSHTMKQLMSELERERIHQLCIDVVREMTSSSVTTLFTTDSVTNALVTRAYQDIVQFEKKHLRLELLPNKELPTQTVFHVQRDRTALSALFTAPSVLDSFHCEYVILLIHKGVTGCITIGAPVGPIVYDSKLLEQIRLVAGLVQLALVNAQQFEEINRQRDSFKTQSRMLKKLNKALRTINSSETLNELFENTLTTLQFALGVESALIAMPYESGTQVEAAIGLGALQHTKTSLLTQDVLDNLENGSIVSYTKCPLEPYFSERYLSEYSKEPSYDSNCLLITPIESSGWSDTAHAYLVVLKQNKALTEEQVLIIESLCSSIAPSVKQLKQLKNIDEEYIQKPEIVLQKLYTQYQADRQEYDIAFEVHMSYVKKIPFMPIDYTQYEGYDYVHIGDVLVLFCELDSFYDPRCEVLIPSSFEDVTQQIQSFYTRSAETLHSCS